MAPQDEAPMPGGPVQYPPNFVGPRIGPSPQQAYLQEIDARVNSSYGGSVPDIKFDPDGVDKVIERLQRLLRDMLTKRRDVQDLHSVTPPGNEYASAGFANRANAAGISYRDYLNEKIAALQGYIKHLEKIKSKYLLADEDQASAFRRTDTDAD